MPVERIPPPPSRFVDYLCVEHPNEWINLDAYSTDQLQELDALLKQAIEEKGDEETKQAVPTPPDVPHGSEGYLTYREVLSNVVGRLHMAKNWPRS